MVHAYRNNADGRRKMHTFYGKLKKYIIIISFNTHIVMLRIRIIRFCSETYAFYRKFFFFTSNSITDRGVLFDLF